MQKINLQLFGKVIDLTEELSSENPKLKLGEKEYEINTSFKVILELDKLFKSQENDVSFIQSFLKTALGAKAATEILNMNLNVKTLKRVVTAIGEEIKGDDDEEESGNAS